MIIRAPSSMHSASRRGIDSAEIESYWCDVDTLQIKMKSGDQWNFTKAEGYDLLAIAIEIEQEFASRYPVNVGTGEP